MPEKLDRCVDKVKGQKGVESAWAICKASLKEVSPTELIRREHELLAGGIPEEQVHQILISEFGEANTKPYPPYSNSPGMKEHHNPLDIPFGREVPETENDKCRICGKPEREHGMFSDHDYEPDNLPDDFDDVEEAVSIPGSLSGVSVGAKRHPDQIKELECGTCPVFDKVHAALKRGY